MRLTSVLLLAALALGSTTSVSNVEADPLATSATLVVFPEGAGAIVDVGGPFGTPFLVHEPLSGTVVNGVLVVPNTLVPLPPLLEGAQVTVHVGGDIYQLGTDPYDWEWL